MPTLRQILHAPELASTVCHLAGDSRDRRASSVAVVEDLAALDRVRPDSIALLGADLSKAASTYQFDVALRVARARGVCAVILSGHVVDHLRATSTAIAERASIAILRAEPDANLADIAIAIAREIAGGAESALLRAHQAMRAMAALPPDARPADILEAASHELGAPIVRDDRPGDGLAAGIRSEGEAVEWLCTPVVEGHERVARELVLQMTASAVTQSLTLARHAEELPIQSRAEVLSQLLEAPAHRTAPLVARARDLDVPIDGWHVVARIERDDDTDDGHKAYEARQHIASLALRTVRSRGGIWHSARSGTALVLVRMWREDPGIKAVSEVLGAADRAIDSVRRRYAGTTCRCGVGTVHAGALGLVSSAAEARAAIVASQPTQRVNTAVAFDGTGLRRSLVEWYASQTAHEAVQAVLAPLNGLGEKKAQTALETLQAYLDNDRSYSRTAEALHLHRNAVVYRIKRIFSVLDVDPDNADDRLLLQLACRAQGLT